MLEMYLRQIFIRLHRHFLSSVSHDNTHKADEIDNAVSYFSEHYNEPINIDSYAEQNNISTSWFIRNFRLYTGITPKQFIMRKREYTMQKHFCRILNITLTKLPGLWAMKTLCISAEYFKS